MTPVVGRTGSRVGLAPEREIKEEIHPEIWNGNAAILYSSFEVNVEVEIARCKKVRRVEPFPVIYLSPKWLNHQ